MKYHEGQTLLNRLEADDLLQQDEEYVLIPLCREAAIAIRSYGKLLLEAKEHRCPETFKRDDPGHPDNDMGM